MTVKREVHDGLIQELNRSGRSLKFIVSANFKPQNYRGSQLMQSVIIGYHVFMVEKPFLKQCYSVNVLPIKGF